MKTCDGCGKKHNTKELMVDGKKMNLCDGCFSKKKKDSYYDHIDVMELRQDKNGVYSFMEDSFKETPEGYLTGRAVVTNIGVFNYMNDDGSIRRELRAPEDVFDEASIRSIKNKIITNEHPSEMVDVSNVKELQVGFVGSDVWVDPLHISVPITITDKDTIEDIKAGKRALSCGYKADMVAESGNFCGVNYDARQTRIRYNHIAIVDRARAGDAARIKMDSIDGVAVSDIQEIKNHLEDKMDPNLKTIKMDGVEYKAEAEVIKAVNVQTERADKAESALEQFKTDHSNLEAERDTLKEKVDSLEKEMDELRKSRMDEKAIQKAVDEKIVLLNAAAKAGVEVKEDMADMDIRRAVILKVFPNAEEKLDEKKDDIAYLSARFDSAVESLEDKNDKEFSDSFIGEKPNNDISEINEDHSDAVTKAQEAMYDRFYKTSRGIKE